MVYTVSLTFGHQLKMHYIPYLNFNSPPIYCYTQIEVLSCVKKKEWTTSKHGHFCHGLAVYMSSTCQLYTYIFPSSAYSNLEKRPHSLAKQNVLLHAEWEVYFRPKKTIH